MSSMANEMQARIEADGGAGLPEGGAGVVPGSGDGGQQGNAPAPQAAGPSNTDTGAGGTAPDTIPYARFKEVNDQLAGLRDYGQLREMGYDPDSLGRLAVFEQSYAQDPVGTVHFMVNNLDLPQDVKDAFEAKLHEHKLLEGSSGSAEGESSGDGGTNNANLPPEVQEKLAYVDKLQQRDRDADNDAKLNAVMTAWKGMDDKDGVRTPSERAMLVAISGIAQNGRFATAEELASAARELFVEYRGEVLGDAVRGTGRNGIAPAPLPGSAPAAAGPINFGTDIKAATRAAKEAMARGELPPLSLGE